MSQDERRNSSFSSGGNQFRSIRRTPIRLGARGVIFLNCVFPGRHLKYAMQRTWSFVVITMVERGGCYLDAQYASNRPRRPFTNRSSMARKKIAIEAPAIAPDDDGAQDLNKMLSPPVVWKYGCMVNCAGRERSNRGRGEQARSQSGVSHGWSNRQDINNETRELMPGRGAVQTDKKCVDAP